MKKETADKYFSLYIRLRDADENGTCECCTCGKLDHYKNMDAGHFINRRFNSVRFNEQNVHAQCPHCNRYCEGNIPEYSLFIERKYGKGTVEKLIAQKNTYTKMGKVRIDEIGKEYRVKMKELAKEKGIEL